MTLISHFILICLLSLSLYCLPVSAQTVDLNKHYAYGMPLGMPSNNDLIVREIYALSSNDDTKFADWVAYRLDKNTVNGNASTSRNYRADPDINPDETLEPEDYKDAYSQIGTTRGHQAPLGTFKGTSFWSQTNYFSNLTPQKENLNGGVWLDLENRVRGIAKQCDVVYVMTGTLYERDMPELPRADEPHVIPSGYWKIVALNVESDPENLLASAFIYDQNTSKNASIESGQVTINEVEERSGLDFFSELPDATENIVESDLTYVFDASLRRNDLCQLTTGSSNSSDSDGFNRSEDNGDDFVGSSNGNGIVRIIEMLPNPEGNEDELESITIENTSNETIDLNSWQFTDKVNTSWNLDSIGSIAPGETVEILRDGADMALNNGGDTVKLFDNNGVEIDRASYSRTTEGVPVKFLGSN